MGMSLGDGKVRTDHDGVVYAMTEGATIDVPWADLVGVHATRYDCKTDVQTLLELERDGGFVLEIHDSCEGYPDLIAALGQRLGLPDAWYAPVEALDVQPESGRTGSVTLWTAVDPDGDGT